MRYEELVGGAQTRPTVKPVVTTTATEAVWRQRAGKGWFVKVQTTQTASRKGGLLPVEFLADDDAVAYGRLETVQGGGSTFTATLELCGTDGYALGTEDPAVDLTDAEIGQTVLGSADGKLKIAANGFGRVVGGDTKDLRLAWDLRENVR